MSVIFKDYDKSAADIFSEDFDLKNTIKTKVQAPKDILLTQTTTVDFAKGLSTKLSTKYSSGDFTLDKLDITADSKFAIESSYVDAGRNLKVEFKGNDSGKADIFATWKGAVATVAGDLDVFAMAKTNVSVHTKPVPTLPLTIGASTCYNLKKGAFDCTTFGATYSLGSILFASAKLTNGFSNISGYITYAASPLITLAATACSKSSSFSLGGVYKCNPNTTLKLKGSSAGAVNLSVKQAVAKGCTAIAAAELPTSSSGFKLGVNITLG